MKNKLVSLIHGTDEGAYWSFSIMVRRNGTIEERNRFTYRSKGSKHITLISGTEDGFSWRFRMLLREDSSILELNKFDCRNNVINYVTNRKERLRLNKEWQKKNRARLREYEKIYYRTKEGNKAIKKQHAKHRKLGFIPINTHSQGMEAHHLDTHFVVYISKELHRSIPHNVWSGWNMQAINEAAMGSLFSERK